MKKTILLKDALIYDNQSPYHQKRMSILIAEGKIQQIAPTIEVEADKIVEIEGLTVSIGWFDMRSVLMEPGFEHKDTLDTLILSASFGGFTDIAVLPNTSPITQTKTDLQRFKRLDNIVQIHPIAAVSKNIEGLEMTEMLDLHQHGAVAFSDGLHANENISLTKNVLLYLQPFDGLFINTPIQKELANNGLMHEGRVSTSMGMKAIPNDAEAMAIQRDLAVLEYVGGKIHFSTISTAESVNLIREAKKRGLNVTCDVAAYQLAFTDEDLLEFDTNLKVYPPFRSEADRKALWEGIANDTIDAICSNHYPQDTESKELEFDLADFGILSLETAFPVLNTLKPDFISTEKILEKITVAPRQILNINPPKIEENQKAVLTVFNEELQWQFEEKHIQSLSKNTPFVGNQFKGKAIGIINGEQDFWVENLSSQK